MLRQFSSNFTKRYTIQFCWFSLHAIRAEPSIGMTAAMNAIGASREEENRASIQKTKEQILKRLNAKVSVLQ